MNMYMCVHIYSCMCVYTHAVYMWKYACGNTCMNNLVENKAILIGNMALLKEYRALSTGHRALLMVHIQNVHID